MSCIVTFNLRGNLYSIELEDASAQTITNFNDTLDKVSAYIHNNMQQNFNEDATEVINKNSININIDDFRSDSRLPLPNITLALLRRFYPEAINWKISLLPLIILQSPNAFKLQVYKTINKDGLYIYIVLNTKDAVRKFGRLLRTIDRINNLFSKYNLQPTIFSEQDLVMQESIQETITKAIKTGISELYAKSITRHKNSIYNQVKKYFEQKNNNKLDSLEKRLIAQCILDGIKSKDTIDWGIKNFKNLRKQIKILFDNNKELELLKNSSDVTEILYIAYLNTLFNKYKSRTVLEEDNLENLLLNYNGGTYKLGSNSDIEQFKEWLKDNKDFIDPTLTESEYTNIDILLLDINDYIFSDDFTDPWLDNVISGKNTINSTDFKNILIDYLDSNNKNFYEAHLSTEQILYLESILSLVNSDVLSASQFDNSILNLVAILLGVFYELGIKKINTSELIPILKTGIITNYSGIENAVNALAEKHKVSIDELQIINLDGNLYDIKKDFNAILNILIKNKNNYRIQLSKEDKNYLVINKAFKSYSEYLTPIETIIATKPETYYNGYYIHPIHTKYGEVFYIVSDVLLLSKNTGGYNLYQTVDDAKIAIDNKPTASITDLSHAFIDIDLNYQIVHTNIHYFLGSVIKKLNVKINNNINNFVPNTVNLSNFDTFLSLNGINESIIAKTKQIIDTFDKLYILFSKMPYDENVDKNSSVNNILDIILDATNRNDYSYYYVAYSIGNRFKNSALYTSVLTKVELADLFSIDEDTNVPKVQVQSGHQLDKLFEKIGLKCYTVSDNLIRNILGLENDKQTPKAFVKNGIIYINLHKYSETSAFHEYTHILLYLLKHNSPETYSLLIENYKNKLKNKFKSREKNDREYDNLLNRLKETYGNNTNEDDLLEELLATDFANYIITHDTIFDDLFNSYVDPIQNSANKVFLTEESLQELCTKNAGNVFLTLIDIYGKLNLGYIFEGDDVLYKHFNNSILKDIEVYENNGQLLSKECKWDVQ